MKPNELLRFLALTLERLRICYLVTGSTATSAYGEPRYTNDLDVVVDLLVGKVQDFCAAFPADSFYVSTEAAIDAVRRRSQFNILHPSSGLKIDVIVASDSAFDRSRLQRGRQLAVLSDCAVWFASPEDVILKKLEYYREGGSEKHLRDIAGVLRIRGDQIDREYINEWAARLDLMAIWQQILERLDKVV